MLRKKAGLSESDIKLFEKKMQTNGFASMNIMASLYYLFEELRSNLQKGVQSEATRIIKGVFEDQEEQSIADEKTAMELAFQKYSQGKIKEFTETVKSGKSDELKDEIDNLLKTVAICGFYDLRIPSNLAYRIFKALDYAVISSIAHIPFFIYENTEDGYDYTFGIRTKLEAQLLLEYYEISQPAKQIKIISSMIRGIKRSGFYDQNSEVRMVSELLYTIGPNAKPNKNFHAHYPEIIDALRDFREKSAGDIHLTLSEITYMREYANDRYNKCQKNNEEENVYKKQLAEAIEIGKVEISKLSGEVNQTIDNINIEIANNLIKLCDFSNDITECQEAIDRSLDVISRNPGNSFAYSSWIKATLLKYNILKNKSTDAAELLAESCDFIDRVRDEHQDISSDSYFFGDAKKLLEYESKYKVDEYFSELLELGSSAGIILKTREALLENHIDIYKGEEKKITEKEVCVCKKICVDWLENSQYKKITSHNLKCQILLLRLKWIIYNKEPIFCISKLEKRYTHITEIGWHEILNICEYIRSFFYETDVYDYYSCHIALYVLSLAYAQTNDFQRCNEIIKTIREETALGYDNDRTGRIVVQHILCDAAGKPLEFDGSFVNTTKPDEIKGFVNINKIEKNHNGKSGIYYHRNDMPRSTQRIAGQYYKDFQLGLGFMGLGVYRGLGKDNGGYDD